MTHFNGAADLVLTGMEKHSDEYREDLLGNSEAFIGAMKTHMRALHMSALQTAMNELSNHDHSRFLTRTNHRVGRISMQVRRRHLRE